MWELLDCVVEGLEMALTAVLEGLADGLTALLWFLGFLITFILPMSAFMGLLTHVLVKLLRGEALW